MSEMATVPIDKPSSTMISRRAKHDDDDDDDGDEETAYEENRDVYGE